MLSQFFPGRHPLGHEQAQLIEQAERDGQHELTDDIRWCDNGGHHEGRHNEVGPKVHHALEGHHPHADQHHLNHRCLERQPKDQEEAQGKAEVFVDVSGHLNTGRRVRGHKTKDRGKNKEIGKGHADQEQDKTRGHNGQRQFLFMRVEAWRNEGPGLVEHIRQCNHKSHEHGDLHGHKEGRSDIGGNHARALRQGSDQGFSKDRVDLRGPIDQHQKHHQDSNRSADQTIP